MDLLGAQCLHALADVVFEVLAADDRGTGVSVVQVRNGFEARVAEGFQALAVAARHHPSEYVLVDHHVSSDDGDRLLCRRLLELCGLESVDGWEFILPLLREGDGDLLREAVAQDSSFGAV